MEFQSNRVKDLPTYVFSAFNTKKRILKERGVDVIDLGIGDPDLPTPPHIVDRLREELNDPYQFKYPPYEGIRDLRQAVADHYLDEYNVSLNPDKEVLILIGSKEGIYHFIPSVINPADIVLVPDPGYPVYQTAIQLAGGKCYPMELTKQNKFKPEFSKIPQDILAHSSLMFLNYPGNPTSATVDIDFFEEAVSFAKENNIPIAHDFAYGRVTYGDYKAPSILQAKGAMDICVEFGSFSKTYCMTGWRIGYAVGNKEMINGLSRLKSTADSGQFMPIQKTATFALKASQDCVKNYNNIYYERMIMIVDVLKEVGIKTEAPKGSLFVWAEVPDGYTSKKFAEDILEETGVVVTPGSAFGDAGEGYFRISLSVDNERLKEAVKRIKHYLDTKPEISYSNK